MTAPQSETATRDRYLAQANAELDAMLTGLVEQERQGTTLICRANYDVMRATVEFLVSECCADAACSAPAKSPKVA